MPKYLKSHTRDVEEHWLSKQHSFYYQVLKKQFGCKQADIIWKQRTDQRWEYDLHAQAMKYKPRNLLNKGKY